MISVLRLMDIVISSFLIERLSIDLALKMYDSKEYSIRQILDASKLSKTTFYRYLNKRNA
ncbi:hypothetical protein EfmJHP38_02660 [Enterococcus faecium]|nr:hypothetical protein EfmJHP38_02660 [Enterococcus faecium]